MQKVLNDKAVSLIQQAIDMAKNGKKNFNDSVNNVAIRVEKNGDFTVITKMNNLHATKKPVVHADFYNLEPYSILIYGRKTKKTLFKGEWINRVLTVRKIQLIKH